MICFDFFNSIIRRLNLFWHKFLFLISTYLERLYVRSIGVNLGKNCRFKGWTSFFRSRGSFINISNNCSFNSSPYTNHIGLNHPCIICTHSNKAIIEIGDNTGMSSTTINCWNKITIGENVRIGANCIIMDGDFHTDDIRSGSPNPINICDKVWLGANVVVMKGVTIGENTIIGINSVVTRDIPSNCVAAGNPCKVIRPLLL